MVTILIWHIIQVIIPVDKSVARNFIEEWGKETKYFFKCLLKFKIVFDIL